MSEKLTLTSLTNNELKEFINDAVRDAMLEYNPKQDKSNEKSTSELITTKELSKLLKKSETTLWKWRKTGKIPYLIGGEKSILYDWDEVQKSLYKSNQQERLKCLE